jgi:S1-C subfamily serine protease
MEAMRRTLPVRSLLAAAAVLVALVVAAVALAARAPHPALGTGVVDVTTNLAYQGGSAAGTGIVLTSNGEVLTNNHVIRGATTVRVTVPSTGRSYAATVVGYSVTGDVAVLQLKGASHLKTVALGNSSSVKVGQHVTALGNAGGRGGKPARAAGTVTGLQRTIVASDGQGLSEQLVGLIRTNARLEPGDSGGPLVNAAGRVIGMDTAASARFVFQSANEAYAIPINRALSLAKQIVTGHASATVHVGSTPFLGVSVAPADSYQQTAGALVTAVVPGLPADQAGIVAGDTIVAVDGRQITSYQDLGSALLRHQGGDTVTLTWVDQTGATQTASVKTVSGPPQ